LKNSLRECPSKEIPKTLPSTKAMVPTPIDKPSPVQYYKRFNIDLSTTQTQTLGIHMISKKLF
jgi:hypothetical protein